MESESKMWKERKTTRGSLHRLDSLNLEAGKVSISANHSSKAIPISKVELGERYLFRQVEPKEYKIFRCVVRYGYNDLYEDPVEFENQLVENLKEFIRQESFILEIKGKTSTIEQVPILETEMENISQVSNINDISAKEGKSSSSTNTCARVENEIKFIEKAMEKGLVYLLGEAEVVADPKSSIINKVVVNYAYSFLRKNFRQGDKLMAIPRKRLLKVGMTYEI
ncbi:unnamed protein product [Lupinus luteus]|uniref:K+ potassium transporter C-terminal domain-containing protein n=1 Tax=Lupinus luteus TaxID=3873 RepID=A0AAV1XAN2_LUPLU